MQNKKYTNTDIEEMRRLRFEEKLTLREIGEKYSFSRERARQLIGNTKHLHLLHKPRRIKGYFHYRKGALVDEQIRILKQRFYLHIQKDNETQCWNWIGSNNGDGYTRMYTFHGCGISSRKFAHYLKFKEYPKSFKQIRYKCGNRKCCNPDHEIIKI